MISYKIFARVREKNVNWLLHFFIKSKISKEPECIIEQNFLIIISMTRTAFKQVVLSEWGKMLIKQFSLPYVLFSPSHFLLHNMSNSNSEFTFGLAPTIFYIFWKPWVLTFREPKCIGVMIQIKKGHFCEEKNFSLIHVLFSPSLTLCFTLFE